MRKQKNKTKQKKDQDNGNIKQTYIQNKKSAAELGYINNEGGKLTENNTNRR